MRSIRPSSLTPSQSRASMKSLRYLRPLHTARRATAIMIEKGEPTKDIWVYDYRTGIKHTMATKPVTRAHLQDFVDCYKSGAIQDRKATYDKDTNPNGRWRCFTQEEFNVEAEKDNSLDFKWLDLE